MEGKRFDIKRIAGIVLRALLAFVITLGLGAAGYFILPTLDDVLLATVVNSAYAAVALLVALLIISTGASYAFVASKNKNMRLQRERIMARRENIHEDCHRARKRLSRLRIAVIAYIVAVVLLAVLGAFVFGFDTENMPWIFLLLFIFFDIFTSISLIVKEQKPPELASREEYPRLYAVADRAAEKLGVCGKIYIKFVTGTSAGVLRIGNESYIFLGPLALGYLTEDELYEVLLHEFAHIKQSSKADKRNRNFLEYFRSSGFSVSIFKLAGVFYSYELMIYDIYASVLVEENADRAMSEYGDAQTAANALAKIELYSLFQQEEDMHMGSFYESEECPNAIGRQILDTFLKVYPTREEFWRGIIENEIQPLSASHPILRNRLQAVGAESYSFVLPETEGAYREECNKVLSKIDAEVYENSVKTYDEERKEAYLEPLATVEEWEKNGKEYDVASFRTIISALSSLRRYDDMVELCDRIIENEQGGMVQYAKFMRGNYRLDNYDDRGIDDLYDSTGNSNYVEDAVNRIGVYCCKMGLREQLEDYRSRVSDFAQKDFDEQGVNNLTVNDRLTEDTDLSRELFDRNRDYIISVGEGVIERIYLVRKQVTKTLSSSVYVVEFTKDATDEQQYNIIDKIFVFLDSTPEDWQYGLFYYDKTTAPAVKKVKGSCIYQRQNNAEEQ